MEAGVAVEVLHEGEDLRIVRVEAADGARSLWRIPAAQVVDARSRRRLRREAALLREVAGPGIAELRAVSDDDDEPALIFADPGGELLLSRMRRGELDVDTCVELGIRLASALGRLHLQRRVVGGLRPSTILYGPAGEVALLDLQRAQRRGGATEGADEDADEPGDLPWELLLYAAPEQCGRVARELSFAADLYNLGGVLYEALVGHAPFPTFAAGELVHAHLAKIPEPPAAIDPTIPAGLSAIVTILIAKEPGDRYASAFALRRDLERLRAALAAGRGEAFRPRPRSELGFIRTPPPRLGREAPLAAITAALERVRDGAAAFVLLEGPDESGASALLRAAVDGAIGARMAALGSFACVGEREPYRGLREALSGLVGAPLRERPESRERWRWILREALGDTLGPLCDLVPELAAVAGAGEDEGRGEAALPARLQEGLGRLLGVFAAPEAPLLFGLEALHAADRPSLALLRGLLGEPPLGLLVVATWTPDEAPAELRQLLREHRDRVDVVRVEPLVQRRLREFIGAALSEPPEAIAALADALFAKTGGVPVTALALLRELARDGALTFDAEAMHWRWDAVALTETPATEDALTWLLRGLEGLAEDDALPLRWAALLGPSFTAVEVAEIAGIPVAQAERGASAAAEAGILVDDGGGWRFSHARARQALIDAIGDEAPTIHLAVARALAERGAKPDDFALADHLRRALPWVRLPEERERFAGILRAAAARAWSAGAFDATARYAGDGLELLGPRGFVSARGLALELAELRADGLYMVGERTEADRLMRLCLDHARRDEEEVAIHSRRLTCAARLGAHDEALCAAAKAFAALDEPFEPQPTAGALLREFMRTHWRLRGGAAESLRTTAPTDDPRALLLLELLYRTCDAALRFRPRLAALLGVRATRLCVDVGGSVYAAGFVIAYGLMLHRRLGDFRAMDELGRLALDLLQRYPDRRVEAFVKFMYGAFILPWVAPRRHTLEHLRDAERAAAEAGQERYISAARLARAGALLELSIPLSAVAGELAGARASARRGELDRELRLARCAGAFVGLLRDEAESARRWELLDALGRTGDRELRHVALSYEAEAALRLGDAPRALRAVTQAAPTIRRALAGSPILVRCDLVHALALLHAEERRAIAPLSRENRRLRRLLRRLERAAELGPHFAHAHALAAAEYAAALGQHGRAMKAYDAAVAGARAIDDLGDEALARELAGRYYLRRGIRDVARVYLVGAHRAYERWEAFASVARLDREFPDLVDRAQLHGPSAIDLGARGEQLDFAAVLMAMQTVARELDIAAILRRLLALALESAGADQGWLLLVDDDEWSVEATATIERLEVTMLRQPARDAGLPASVLHHAARTHEAVVLDDAARSGPFTRDPQIVARGTRSLVALPMFSQGRLIGLLYLENRLAAGVFTSARLQILRILAGQAAVSIEISRLYARLAEANRSLEARVEERTGELRRALAELREAQRHIVQSEKMAALGGLVAGVAHEINTPIGIGVTAASLLAERTEELMQRYRDGALTRSDLSRYLAKARESSQMLLGNLSRAADLIASFKLVAVDQSSEKRRTFALKPYVEQVLVSLRPERRRVEHRIEVHGDDALVITSFPGAIAQLITNLLMNALTHAFAPGEAGTITIRLTRANGRIWLDFADDGRGIPPENLERIFEPFFTTGRERGGSGLGLHIVYNIVSQTLGGTIRCESEVGRGTRFVVELPAEAGDAGSAG